MNNNNNNQVPSVDDIFGTGASNNQGNNGSLENTNFNNSQILNGASANVSSAEPNVNESVNFDNNNANNSQVSSIDASASVRVEDVFGSGSGETFIQTPNVNPINNNVDNNSINNVNQDGLNFNGSSTPDVPTFQVNDNVNTFSNNNNVNLNGENIQGANGTENNMGAFSNIDVNSVQNEASNNVVLGATNGQVDIQNPVSNAIDVNSNVINQDGNTVNTVPVNSEPVNPDSSVGVGIVIDNGNAGFNPVDVQNQSSVSNQVIPNDFNSSVVSNEVNQNNNVADTSQVQSNIQDNSININQNNTDTNGKAYENKDNAINPNDEELINAYVGTKYDKFKNGKFNIWALLFGPLYLAYRKMFWYGIGLCVVETILTNFIKIGFWFGLVLRIVLALFVNKFYLQEASKKVNKIKSENANVSKDGLVLASKITGGVSKDLLALAMYVTGTITTIALIISMITGTVGFFKDILSNIKWNVTDNNNNTNNTNNNNTSNDDSNNISNDSNENYTFDGVISYNTGININNTFNITIPSGFSEDSFWGSSDYHFNYELDSNQTFGDCKFSFYSPNGYKSAEGLAKAMQKYYVKNSSETSVTTTKINNINWFNFSNVDSFSTEYYYLMSKDDKVYVVSYESGKNNLDICNSYKDSIMNSISLK